MLVSSLIQYNPFPPKSIPTCIQHPFGGWDVHRVASERSWSTRRPPMHAPRFPDGLNRHSLSNHTPSAVFEPVRL
jgi:hypothetical protein